MGVGRLGRVLILAALLLAGAGTMLASRFAEVGPWRPTGTKGHDGIDRTGSLARHPPGIAGSEDGPAPAPARIVAAKLPDGQPFAWSAARSADRIVLDGFWPSQAARTRLAAEARRLAPDLAVDDRLTIVSDAPADIDFDALTSFALAQLADLRSGRIAMHDHTVSISGEARDRDALAAVTAAWIRDLPKGVVPGEAALSAGIVQPYGFQATREAGALTIAGHVPTIEARAAILEAARRRFMQERIVDLTRLGDGAPDTFVAGMTFGLDQLSQMAAGTLVASGTALTVAGEVLYAQAAGRLVETARRGAPKPWQVDVVVRRSGEASADAGLCQQQLGARLAAHGIRFTPDSPDIARPSFPVLNDLAEIAKRCPGARIEIAGDLDGGDTPEKRDLWRRRAQAVSQYLRRAGVEAARLASETAPAGQGESDAAGDRLLVRF